MTYKYGTSPLQGVADPGTQLMFKEEYESVVYVLWESSVYDTDKKVTEKALCQKVQKHVM